MSSNPSISSRAGFAEVRPSEFRWLRATWDLAGASVRFAWPAAVAAMCAFALLQLPRLRFVDQVIRELYVDRSDAISPQLIVRYASWLMQDCGLRVSEGGPYAMTFAVDEVQRRLLRDNPDRLAMSLAVAVLSAQLWAVILGVIGVRRAARSRRILYQLPLATRVQMSCGMLRSAWPWSMIAAVVAGALVWHVGYDREGGTRSVVAGVLPTALQGGVMLAIWSGLSAVMASALQRSSLYACVGVPGSETRICPRCRYPLQGLDATRCPECGTVTGVQTWELDRNARTAHRWIAKRLALGLSVLIILTVGAAMVSIRARDWLRLRPHSVACGFTDVFKPGDGPREFSTVWGVLTLDVRPVTGRAGGAAGWAVTWTLQGRPGTASQSGAFSVSPRPMPVGVKYSPEVHETPVGPLGFHTYENDPRLFIDVPPLIFTHGTWNG